MSLYCILKFSRETREISTRKFPQGFHWEGGKNIHIENSPSFPQGNYEEISTGMNPWNSPINPRGNLGDVDGLPAKNPRTVLGLHFVLGLRAKSSIVAAAEYPKIRDADWSI